MEDRRSAVEVLIQKTQHPHRVRICRDTDGKDIWATVSPEGTTTPSVTGSHLAEGGPVVKKSKWDYSTRCRALEGFGEEKWKGDGVKELLSLYKCEYFTSDAVGEAKIDKLKADRISANKKRRERDAVKRKTAIETMKQVMETERTRLYQDTTLENLTPEAIIEQYNKRNMIHSDKFLGEVAKAIQIQHRTRDKPSIALLKRAYDVYLTKHSSSPYWASEELHQWVRTAPKGFMGNVPREVGNVPREAGNANERIIRMWLDMFRGFHTTFYSELSFEEFLDTHVRRRR